MKKLSKMFLSVLMATSLIACSSSSSTPNDTNATASYIAGTYTYEAEGYGGTVTVTITTDDSTITDVVCEGPNETDTVGGAALEELAEQIKTAQSAEIDGVSGATYTSNGIKEAAAKVIEVGKVGVDFEKMKEVLDNIDAAAYWEGRDCGTTTYTENGYTYSYSGVTSGVLLKTDGTRWYEYLGDEYFEPWSEITEPDVEFTTMSLDEATSIITNINDGSWLASITGVCDRSDARLYFENWLDDNGYSLVASSVTVYSHDSTLYCIAYTRFGDVYAFMSTDGGQTYTKVDCDKKEATRILKNLNNIDWSLRHGYIDSSIEQGPKYYE